MQSTDQVPAYLALANSLETQVLANVFRPGDRLPSVRTLCGDHRLSMETVLHTLRVLEDRGLIEARPRSGFYVKFRNRLRQPLPQPLRLEASPGQTPKKSSAMRNRPVITNCVPSWHVGQATGDA